MLKTLSINVLKLILISIFIIVILEYLLQIYSNIKGIKFANDNRYSNIYRVYHEGEMFEPYDKFYLYKKNLKEKRFLNFYLDKKKEKLVKIWDYNFSTNNYGLVQKSDLDSNKRSILFLGDSFTQGTGSESWVDNISENFNEFQIVNGGFGATGFIQFSNLNDHLSSKLNIDKRVVIFISQDIRRNIIIFENTKCLVNHLFCNKNNKLIGIPHNMEFNIEKFILENISKEKTFNSKKKN